MPETLPVESSLNYWHRDARRRRMQKFFEDAAAARPAWKQRNRHYHREVERFYRGVIPPGARVVDLGCGDGDVLAAVRPSCGVGIDWSETMLAQAAARHPDLTFVLEDVEQLRLEEPFDYVICSNVLGSLVDVQRALEHIRKLCHPGTRLIITDDNALWKPVMRLAQALGWAMPQPPRNWLSRSTIVQVLELSGFSVIKTDGRLLCPLPVPWLASWINHIIARLPLLGRLGCLSVVLARPTGPPAVAAPSCSVIIPCRNERGTIEALVSRIPDMGSETEIIFIDGHSPDGTAEEIERVIAAMPHRRIRLIRQTSAGKRDAVREGFAEATGEIFMILDADMTVSPEELLKFYRALVDGHGELIYGVRLAYPMDGKAMQRLNVIANKGFAMLFSYLLEQPCGDTMCGMRALWRSDYARIRANQHFFGEIDPFGDFDLLFGAARLNLQTTGIPVRYTERMYGRTNIRRFVHGWQLLQMCCTALRPLKFSS